MAQGSLLHRFILTLFGVYSATCLLFVTISAIILLTLPLKLELRRKITSTAARTWFVLTGVPIQQYNHEFSEIRPAVVVANHASYIDGILLHAILPVHFAFVIKREVTKVPLLHFLLRRIGSHFVERNNQFRSGKDAKNILQHANSGRSIAIFPEGTFSAKPGLKKFRAGAFAAATSASLPVIPVVIKGTRDILSASHLFPRPGKIHVRFLEPITTEQTGKEAMRAVAEQSRNAILEHLGEPDLIGAAPP